MDPPSMPSVVTGGDDVKGERELPRAMSFSQSSDDSQTAAEYDYNLRSLTIQYRNGISDLKISFIDRQLKLEADAREALPYKFDACTKPLGPLRQLLFACLTCNPPPAPSAEPYTPAAVCYSCSVECHGEHTLVELFNKRNFVCDCGTTRIPTTSPCTLRLNPVTNQKGGVVSEPAEDNNKYNHNFWNRFCGCDCDYDAHNQKGTMFQCLGLGTAEQGGCGEDWYHTGCIMGLGPAWYEDQGVPGNKNVPGTLETITEEADGADENSIDDDLPHAPGFPDEDDFEGFICYKCVDSNPWIKRYAGTRGFLMPVFKRSPAPSPEAGLELKDNIVEIKDATALFTDPESALSGLQGDQDSNINIGAPSATKSEQMANPTELKVAADMFETPIVLSRKRKASEEDEEETASSKRFREDNASLDGKAVSPETTGTSDKLSSSEVRDERACKYEQLPRAPERTMSLFFKSDFREHLCHCPDCFPRTAQHPQLLEEEEAYEPPVSEDEDDGGGSTVGSGSLLDRGERALTNVDRVRAIEGVMAYNHLKEKLKPFFKEFADSGKAISAEDIKAHFAKMRGDEEAIKQAGEAAANGGDIRREQSGY